MAEKVLWLSRLRSGRYILTEDAPLLRYVGKTRVKDFYFNPGEPIGVPNMCSAILHLVESKPLKRLTSVRVKISGCVIKE